MLLVDELRRCGVELVFLNHEIGETQGYLLLQMQGMSRCRRARSWNGSAAEGSIPAARP